MGATWTNAGIYKAALAIDTGPAIGFSWRFGLYTNAITPTFASVITDFTQPSNSTYGKISGTAWSLTASVAGVNLATLGTCTWLFSANAFVETVRGFTFEIFDGSSWVLCAMGNLTIPYLIPPGGGSLAETFTLSVQKLP